MIKYVCVCGQSHLVQLKEMQDNTAFNRINYINYINCELITHQSWLRNDSQMI